MTGQWQETRPRTQRGLCLLQTSCGGAGSACRGAGRGGLAGTLLQLGRSRKGAGSAKNVRKRLFTRGRGGIPSPSPGRPPTLWTERSGTTTPGGRGRSWGGARVWISVELRDRPSQCRFASCNPPPSMNTLPNSCRLAGASTPASSLLGAWGFPGLGVPREKCPASSTFL